MEICCFFFVDEAFPRFFIKKRNKEKKSDHTWARRGLQIRGRGGRPHDRGRGGRGPRDDPHGHGRGHHAHKCCWWGRGRRGLKAKPG